MKLDKINIIILLTLVVAFCVFVIFWEKTDLEHTKNELKEHTQVIAISLWNLDSEGPSEYLKLAAKLNNYEHIAVFAVTDELFIEVTGQVGQLDRFFHKIGLIPKIKFAADIFFDGRVVGSMEVIHFHDTIYVYLYLLIIIGLILLVANFFTQTLQAKHTLEERVQERTEELKVANKKLLLSEERYREIFNTPSDAIFMHDADTGKILDVNQGMLTMYGYTFEEALQQNIGDLSLGESPYTIEEAGLKVQNAVQHGPQLFEWMGKKKNGDLFWAEVALKHTKFSGHQYVVAVVRDINDRKLAEKQIERSNALLKSLIDSIPDLIFYKDKESVYLGCNEAFTRFVGQDKEAIVGRTDLDLFGKDIAEFFREKDRQMLAEGKPRHNEEWVDYPDGRHVLLDTLKTPFYTSDNKVLGLIGISRDITERKRVEEVLRISKEEWEKTFNAIPDIITLQDINMQIVRVNKAACDFFKMGPQDFIGKKCYAIFRNISKPCPDCPTFEIFQDKLPHIEIIEHKKLGKIFHVATSPILDNNNEIQYIAHIARDITTQKKLEEELFQAHKMEAIGTLAGGIAHDFNNILSAIMGYSELAKLDIPPESSATKKIDEVIKASKRAADLVTHILTFSRKSDQRLKALEPHLIIKEALKMLRASLPTTIKILADIDSKCGKVMADPTNIHQIIVNLCTNSLHAMEDEKGVLSVSLYRKEISAEEINEETEVSAGPFIVIEVGDTGQGMDQATIERVFDPYFTTKGVGKGTGLGLSVIHGIIQDYHGFIRLESEPGKGTTFYVHIPALQEETTIIAETSPSEPPPTGTERILLVDDESMVVNLNKAVLERFGYKVTATTESLDALEKIRSDPDQFDLIITDQTMPNLTGAELAQEILKIKHTLPIILCTGYSSVLSEEEALAIGIRKYARKPVDRTTLAKIVRQVLDDNQE